MTWLLVLHILALAAMVGIHVGDHVSQRKALDRTPPGTRVRMRLLSGHHAHGTVVRVGKRYVHVRFDRKPERTYPCAATELEVLR